MALLRRDHDERGASAVEFALVLPILVVLVFGMIDFGWAINRYATIGNAAREGARVASLGGTPGQISAAVEDFMDTDVTVTVSCKTPTGGACGSYANAQSGGTAVVRVDYSGSWLTPVAATFSDEMNLSKTSMMRIE